MKRLRALRRIVGFFAPFILLVAVLVFMAVAARPIAAAAAKADACGNSPVNSIGAQFAIPAASKIFDYFPYMGKTPELSRDDQPAYVVVFDGTYTAGWAAVDQGHPTTPRTYQDVICVIQSDGTVNLYAYVSRVGFTAP